MTAGSPNPVSKKCKTGCKLPAGNPSKLLRRDTRKPMGTTVCCLPNKYFSTPLCLLERTFMTDSRLESSNKGSLCPLDMTLSLKGTGSISSSDGEGKISRLLTMAG